MKPRQSGDSQILFACLFTLMLDENSSTWGISLKFRTNKSGIVCSARRVHIGLNACNDELGRQRSAMSYTPVGLLLDRTPLAFNRTTVDKSTLALLLNIQYFLLDLVAAFGT